MAEVAIGAQGQSIASCQTLITPKTFSRKAAEALESTGQIHVGTQERLREEAKHGGSAPQPGTADVRPERLWESDL